MEHEQEVSTPGRAASTVIVRPTRSAVQRALHSGARTVAFGCALGAAQAVSAAAFPRATSPVRHCAAQATSR